MSKTLLSYQQDLGFYPASKNILNASTVTFEPNPRVTLSHQQQPTAATQSNQLRTSTPTLRFIPESYDMSRGSADRERMEKSCREGGLGSSTWSPLASEPGHPPPPRAWDAARISGIRTVSAPLEARAIVTTRPLVNTNTARTQLMVLSLLEADESSWSESPASVSSKKMLEPQMVVGLGGSRWATEESRAKEGPRPVQQFYDEQDQAERDMHRKDNEECGLMRKTAILPTGQLPVSRSPPVTLPTSKSVTIPRRGASGPPTLAYIYEMMRAANPLKTSSKIDSGTGTNTASTHSRCSDNGPTHGMGSLARNDIPPPLRSTADFQSAGSFSKTYKAGRERPFSSSTSSAAGRGETTDLIARRLISTGLGIPVPQKTDGKTVTIAAALKENLSLSAIQEDLAKCKALEQAQQHTSKPAKEDKFKEVVVVQENYAKKVLTSQQGPAKDSVSMQNEIYGAETQKLFIEDWGGLGSWMKAQAAKRNARNTSPAPFAFSEGNECAEDLVELEKAAIEADQDAQESQASQAAQAAQSAQRKMMDDFYIMMKSKVTSA